MGFIRGTLNFIDIIAVTYLIYFVINGIYIFKERRRLKNINSNHKLAVVVPARNEEKVIGNLLRSLKKQDYPKELYDIYVVANNCTDKTKDIVLQNEVNLLECETTVNTKGEALKIAFEKLKELDYEAYVIFDADNIVHPKFLERMSNTLSNGYELAQGFRDSKNISDTWISGCYSIYYLINNVFLNIARMNINKSCFINGTGFMISKKFIETKGYVANTMTEDIELTVRCAILNEKIAFVEDAITYDEQPTVFNESWKQRRRWSIGTIQCFKLYFKKLIGRYNFESVDSMVFLFSPFIQCLGAISYLSHFIIGFAQEGYLNFIGKIFSLLIWYLVSIVLAISAVKLGKKQIRPYLKGILTLPVFIISWIPINVVAMFKKKTKWEKIEHTKNVTIDKILEIDYK